MADRLSYLQSTHALRDTFKVGNVHMIINKLQISNLFDITITILDMWKGVSAVQNLLQL